MVCLKPLTLASYRKTAFWVMEMLWSPLTGLQTTPLTKGKITEYCTPSRLALTPLLMGNLIFVTGTY